MNIILRDLGQIHYAQSFASMSDFTHNRTSDTLDELWLCEHFPVFTQGRNGKAEHLLAASDIELIQSDRGGQITYHALGQIIMYVLIDCKRWRYYDSSFSIRTLVDALENCVVKTLADYKINAFARKDAPGVYVDHVGKLLKICSLGLRIHRGSSMHGLAFNYAMDLSPFKLINPCGYSDLIMTQLADLMGASLPAQAEIKEKLMNYFCHSLGYTTIQSE